MREIHRCFSARSSDIVQLVSGQFYKKWGVSGCVVAVTHDFNDKNGRVTSLLSRGLNVP